MFKIDKGYEVPTAHPQPRLYPFHSMEPGDSFFIPAEGRAAFKLRKYMQNTCRKYARRVDAAQRYLSVEVEETAGHGVRVWRIK